MPAPLLDYLGRSGAGAPQMTAGVPAGPISVAPGGAPSVGGPPQEAVAPQGMGGGGPVGMMPPGAQAPPQQYQAVTQTDGTVLLHQLNPDGSLGPAVQIIKMSKPGGAGQK